MVLQFNLSLVGAGVLPMTGAKQDAITSVFQQFLGDHASDVSLMGYNTDTTKADAVHFLSPPACCNVLQLLSHRWPDCLLHGDVGFIWNCMSVTEYAVTSVCMAWHVRNSALDPFLLDSSYLQMWADVGAVMLNRLPAEAVSFLCADVLPACLRPGLTLA